MNKSVVDLYVIGYHASIIAWAPEITEILKSSIELSSYFHKNA